MAGGLAQIWREWEIQILVLLSFTLQVFLLAFARIRRRKGSAVLRILLWLAYMMSDSTAIYTLGHLSLRTRSSGSSEKHYLMAFWAPFLLLHLGGPDTITAYALEDNQLWLRHLLTLAVQVLGAAYVLYQLYVHVHLQTPADPLILPDGGKVSASEASLFGCFSARAKVGLVVTAPVMQIMPEFLDLCGDVVMPPSVDEARSERQVVPFGVGVAKSGLSAAASRAIVAREVCDFLATLAAAYPGFGEV